MKIFYKSEINSIEIVLRIRDHMHSKIPRFKNHLIKNISDENGDVPGWVLVVLMTTGLVTAIWTLAAPRLSSILKNSLDSMNNVR
jgi:hypothetical protein